ncbi:hypothetical protein J1605_014438 [Eschrichtius robustus]|uniref:FBA domain-containing protein n=1 Tax=Eschrichtius robustus TaxID=9764 RepID=A0AB34GEK2_ESCRO|nr:hypothetical protein J1605_014438 [Eschrichtius robustus]
MVLSHVPPHVLLGRCRRVCRYRRALVDCQALWLNILARDHAALWPVLRTCLPPRRRPQALRPGPLLRAQTHRTQSPPEPQGRRWCHKKEVLDLEEEGLWPELLDSGKMEICVSDWRTDQQYTDSLYRLIVQRLDASQAVLYYCSPLPFPIPQCRNSFSFEASHVFSNLRIGVHFVSFEHWVRDIDFCSQPYLVYLFNSSVIVRVHLS